MMPHALKIACLSVVLSLAADARAGAYSDLVESHGPIAYWRLGESSGVTAADETGAHDGAYAGGVTLGETGALDGDADTSARFSGSSAVVDLGMGPQPTGSAVTLAAWVYPDNTGSGDRRIFCKATNYWIGDNYLTVHQRDTRIGFRLKTDTGTSEIDTPSGTLTALAWNLVVATYDGAQMRVYVNGVEAISTPKTGTVTVNAAAPTTLGDAPQGGRVFQGLLDEVALFGKALGGTEVAALYDVGINGAEQFFVRPDGDDSNDGTGTGAGDAWASLAHALTQSEVTPGSIVHVMPGVYAGQVAPSIDGTEGLPIRVVGDKGGVVFGVSGEVTLTHSGHVLRVHADEHLSFERLTITNAGHDSAAINTWGADGLVLDRCRVHGAGRDGVELTGDGAVRLVNCVIDNNGYSGVRKYGASATLELVNCTIVSNAWEGLTQNEGVVNATNTLFAHNGTAGAFCGWRRAGGTGTSQNNLYFGNSGSAVCGLSVDAADVTEDPSLADVAAGDYRLGSTSAAINAGQDTPGVTEDFDGASRNAGAYDIGAYEAGGFFYVRVDGSDANDGTGPGASDAWATVSHALTQPEVTAGATVYVMPGNYNGNVAPSIDGSSTEPISIVGDVEGAVFGVAGAVQLSNNGYALDLSGESFLTFRDLAISATNGSGVRLQSFNEGIVFERCRIHDADYYGVDVQGQSEVRMVNCVVSGAGFSGIRSADANAQVEVLHGTIADCAWDGIFQSGGSVTVKNTILAHIGDDCWDLNGGTWAMDNCLFGARGGFRTEGFGSTEEIEGDPRFVDRSVGNFHLGTGSAAIGAGTDLPKVTDDIRGAARVAGAYDIGAYASALVGWWRLDETSGSIAVDSSGRGNDATHSGGVTPGAAGPRKRSAEFDGVDGAASSFPAADDLDGVDALSIAAWVRPSSFPGSTMRIAGNGRTEGFRLEITGDNRARFHIHTSSGAGKVSVVSNAVLATNQWTQLAGVYDGVNLQIYVNGALDKSSTTAGGDLVTNSHAFIIGDRTPGDQPFDGRIDDVVAYARAMSDREVIQHYGLVGHWRLDETSGTTAADASGLGNNATHANGVTVGAAGPYPAEGEYAATYDGFNDQTTVPNESDYDLTEQVTIAAWVRVDDFIRSYQAILTKGHDTWRLQREASGGYVGFYVNSPSTRSVRTNEEIDDGEWHHLVGVYDGETLGIYLDGQLQGSVADTGALRTNGRPVMIGNNHTAWWRRWNGDLHDARVYNRALLPEEVAELYGLVGWWKLDETSGTVAYDSSGKENHGVWSGVASSGQGKINGAADFDGSSLIEVPRLVTSQGSASLAAWVNVTGSNGAGGEVVSLGDGFAIRADQSGLGTSSFVYEGSGWRFSGTGINVRNTGWRHVAATYNAQTLELSTYIDGVLEDTTPLSAPGQLDTLGPETVIGAHGDNKGYYSVGRLDDVRVYNRMISPDEVREMFLGSSSPGLRIISWVEVANP